MQGFIEIFNRGQNMGCNANKKNMGYKKILKNEQIGRMLFATYLEADLWAY